jgi:hypothetical protein
VSRDGLERTAPRGMAPHTALGLVGQRVTVIVSTYHRGYVGYPDVYTGKVIAVGQKYGDHQSRPLCLVLLTASGLVPIISLRQVVDAHTPDAPPHHAVPDAAGDCMHELCRAKLHPAGRADFRHIQAPR